VSALRDIYKGFVLVLPGALPGWDGGGDPCGVGEGVRAGWGGVVCQSTRNGNCTTTVSGLYAPHSLAIWGFET